MASKVAVVTYLLIVVNILVFLMQLPDPEYYKDLIENYGLIPVHVMEGKNLFTLVTSMFFHANFIHLGMNMLFLLITGDGCERAMGSSRFFIFYRFRWLASDKLCFILNWYGKNYSQCSVKRLSLLALTWVPNLDPSLFKVSFNHSASALEARFTLKRLI